MPSDRNRYVGKPHAAIYDRALASLDAVGVARPRVAAVGDSMAHDVAGATAAGFLRRETNQWRAAYQRGAPLQVVPRPGYAAPLQRNAS